MELKETMSGMISPYYKERFKAEYQQTKIRYEKLKAFNNEIEASRLHNANATKEKNENLMAEPTHTCPLGILKKQQKVMGEYLHILEVRAVIEGVDLNDR